jgi:hypothetical protein
MHSAFVSTGSGTMPFSMSARSDVDPVVVQTCTLGARRSAMVSSGLVRSCRTRIAYGTSRYGPAKSTSCSRSGVMEKLATTRSARFCERTSSRSGRVRTAIRSTPSSG